MSGGCQTSTKVGRCEKCPFVTPLCGSKGPEDSPFVIVGESPGTNELRVGKPFVGESGRLLKSVLSQAGFDSLGIEPYVINALSCYPPPAKKSGPDGGKVMQQAVHACQQRVLDQILAHPRKVILTLGAAAAWSVTNDFSIKITRDRGMVMPSNLSTHGIVLAVHPAYLIRNGGGLPFWKKDIKQAVKLLKGEKLGEWQEPTWHVVQAPSELHTLIEEYHAAPLITGDIETDRLHWIANHGAYSDPTIKPDRGILCLGITKDDGSHVDIIPENIIYSSPLLMQKLLSGGTWSWHNSMFDTTWMNSPSHPYGAKADHDTMLMSYALNENRGFHDLDQVAQTWIGAPRHKAMLDQYLPNKEASFRSIPTDILYKYNAIDLSKQHRIFEPLYNAVCASKEASKLYHETLMPAVPELVLMKLHGVKVNEEKVKANLEEHDKQISKLRDQINEYALKHIGAAINPGSTQQLATLLYDKMGLKIPGTRSTAEDVIIKIQRRYDHPICNTILNYRELIKRKGTYVANLLYKKKGKNILWGEGHVKPDGCVYPDFSLHGTQTGRLAGRDPNMLNQPRGALIRSQYEARENKLFVEVDENQAELRSLAVMSGDPLLREIYTKNEVSIHDITTAKFFGSKEAMARDPAVLRNAMHLLQYFGADQSPDAVYKEAKMRGKAVNFGIVYGREAFSLAMEFDIPVAEADRWIKEWMALYSKAAEFIEWCRSRPALNRDLITVFGRKKRHGVVSAEKLRALENEAANFPHQSTASDIMLHTLIRCGPRLREEWDAWAWNEVYDAIYYEIDIDEKKVADSIKFVQETITQVPRDYGITSIPFLGDAKIGFDWGNMKDWKGGIVATLGEDAVNQRLSHPQLVA